MSTGPARRPRTRGRIGAPRPGGNILKEEPETDVYEGLIFVQKEPKQKAFDPRPQKEKKKKIPFL